MKIQLDTDKKTITIEEDVLLSKLIETLDKILPNKEWKKFTLKINTTISYWQHPIDIDKYTCPYIPYKRYDFPWWNNIMCSQNIGYGGKLQDTTSTLNSGVYNIQT